jgi:phage tail-like protein
MRHPEFQCYCFSQADQWRAGALEHLQVTTDGLAVPPAQVFAPIPGTGSRDATPALATDVCDRLHWVRPAEGQLFRLYDFGPQQLGRLPYAQGARTLVVGATRLWLLHETGILRYALRGLQFLDRVDGGPGEPLALAGDGRDGIWWLASGGSKATTLHHADRSGLPVGRPIALEEPITQGALGVSRDGRRVALLDASPPGEVGQRDKAARPSWRLVVVDRDTGEATRFEAIGTLEPGFRPRLLTVDREDHIHLADPQTGQTWTLSFRGQRLDRNDGPLPDDWLPVTAISAGTRIALASGQGMGYLEAVEADETEGRERQSVFITPTLISPEGAQRGWQRADVEALLPEGTTLEVSCVATRDQALARSIDAILADTTRSSAVKARLIEDRLQWQQPDQGPSAAGRRPAGQPGRLRHLPAVVYAGSDEAGGAMSRLRYLLHEVEETHLWLRLVLYTPPGRRPPTLKSLSVSYPNRAYLRYLPAAYQEEQHSAAQLRPFLALFESLFGDLDTVIDRLPRDIDPRTAPADRLPFLLRWLGLPSMDGLDPETQRSLLLAAPELLTERGTLGALGRLLAIIAGVPVVVDDLAAGPAPWVLPGPGVHGPEPRLGCDTLIVAKQPPAFALGRKVKLGGAVLGGGCTDTVQTFAQGFGEIRVRVCATGETRARIEPVIRRFLPYFVPAHCRLQLTFVPRAYWAGGRRLDDDLTLTDKHGAQIGTRAIIGRLRLPETSIEDAVLNRSTCIDGGLHLN